MALHSSLLPPPSSAAVLPTYQTELSPPGSVGGPKIPRSIWSLLYPISGMFSSLLWNDWNRTS